MVNGSITTCPLSSYVVRGLTLSASRAAAMVMGLKIDPGSHDENTTSLLNTARSFTSWYVLGSNDGFEHRASNLPVVGSIITTLPPCALYRVTALSSALQVKN